MMQRVAPWLLACTSVAALARVDVPAEHAGVPAQARAVPAANACAAARHFLSEEGVRHGWGLQVECGAAADADASAGDYSLAHRGLPSLVSGFTRVRLMRHVPSGVQPLAVPVQVTVRSTMWLARADVPAGGLVRPEDLVQDEFVWPVGAAPRPMEAAAPVGRARSALRAGDVVSRDQVASSDELLRGDAVTLAIKTGAMTVELPAVLSANARVGDMARVQLKGRRVSLEGLLADHATVVVDR